MEQSQQPKLSVSMALEGLKEAAEEVERLETALADARALRDDLLRDAYGYVPVVKLARLAKLSRERASRIAGSDRSGV